MTSSVEGTVKAVSSKTGGFTLTSDETHWYNRSNQRQSTALPVKGQRVVVTLDDKGKYLSFAGVGQHPRKLDATSIGSPPSNQSSANVVDEVKGITETTRANALQAALKFIEIRKAAIQTNGFTEDDVINSAKKFEFYLRDGGKP